jgi:hypothetical protein
MCGNIDIGRPLSWKYAASAKAPLVLLPIDPVARSSVDTREEMAQASTVREM